MLTKAADYRFKNWWMRPWNINTRFKTELKLKDNGERTAERTEYPHEKYEIRPLPHTIYKIAEALQVKHELKNRKVKL